MGGPCQSLGIGGVNGQIPLATPIYALRPARSSLEESGFEQSNLAILALFAFSLASPVRLQDLRSTLSQYGI